MQKEEQILMQRRVTLRADLSLDCYFNSIDRMESKHDECKVWN